MAQVDGSIRIGTEITTKQAEKELKSLEGSIAKTVEKIASLRSKMDALKDTKIPTTEYQNLQKEIESTEKKLLSLYDKQERFLETGGKESSPTYQKMVYDAETLEKKLQYAEQAMQNLVDSGKSFALGSDTDKYAQMSAEMQQLNQQMESDTQRQSELQSQLSTEEQRLADIKANATVSDQKILDMLERRKQLMQEIADLEKAGVGLGYQEYNSANQEIAQINSQIKAYKDKLSAVPEKFSNMQKSAKKAFNAVSSGTKKSNGFLSTFISRFKGLALSLLIFNQISKAFNAMISGMKKGFENFMGYSDSFANSIQSMKNSMATLGNQFAAAFAPIVQMVIPWLNSLIGAITTAMSYVAQFIAALTGKSTFTKATQVQDKYNKSLGGTAKAADKARGALAKFDDLDVLQKKDDTSGGGAGGGTGAGDLFEEVPVDPKLQEWLEIILEKAKQLKEIFMKGFWDGLGDWEYRLNSIKNSISSIKQSLIDIWTDPAVLSSADRWIESVAYLLGSISGSIASVGLTIGANLLGGISGYLSGNKDRIKEYLVSMFDIWGDINYLLSDFFQSFAYVFEAFADENGQRLTENLIGIFTNAFMGLNEIISKLIFDILNIFIQPFADNQEAFRDAVDGFLGVLADVLGTIKQGIDDTFDKLNEVYDAHFKPFFDSVAQGLSDLVGKFLEFWNSGVQPILDSLAEKFAIVWVEHIQPALDGFIEMLGMLIELLKIFWEETLAPLIDWVIENILPVILPILDGIIDGFFVLLSGISDIVTGIINVIKGIITFLVGVFTRDWEKAWDGAKKIFNGFKEIVDSIIGTIKDIIQSFIDWVMRMVEKAINALKSIGGAAGGGSAVVGGTAALPTRGERSISAMASYNLDEVPALASGAVIRGGNPFMAILGDQPAGKTNIEAPLDTIKQAVREELAGMDLGNAGSGQTRVVLNINGIDVGEAMLDDLFSVMSRRGYDVSVLGVT